MNMEIKQSSTEELKSSTAVTRESEKLSACFDCSICLDYAHDPVITLCGHLYCWPCIYKWMKSQGSSLPTGNCIQCPICKTEISHASVIPLYGRGRGFSEPGPDDKANALKLIIPPRPSAFPRQLQATTSDDDQALSYVDSYQNIQNPYMNFDDSSLPALSSHGSTTPTAVCHPMFGMFGEMVYARVFGNSQGLNAYPNSYCLAGSSSPNLRRLEIQAHMSLNRVSFFLFCCLVLCFLLF